MKENADKARALDAAELAKQLREGSEQMFRLRFQLRMGQAEGLKKLRTLRKERARLLTVQRERELGKAEAPVAAVSAKNAKKLASAKAAPAAKTVKVAKAAGAKAVKKAAPAKAAGTKAAEKKTAKARK